MRHLVQQAADRFIVIQRSVDPDQSLPAMAPPGFSEARHAPLAAQTVLGQTAAKVSLIEFCEQSSELSPVHEPPPFCWEMALLVTVFARWDDSALLDDLGPRLRCHDSFPGHPAPNTAPYGNRASPELSPRLWLVRSGYGRKDRDANPADGTNAAICRRWWIFRIARFF